MRKFWVSTAFAVVMLFFSFAVCGAQMSATVERGRMAPEFTLKDMEGKPVSLAQFRGKIVVLNFWATWCPPCREEYPTLERLNEVFEGKDFVLLAVNVNTDGVQNLKAFLAKHFTTFSILPDPDGVVQNLYGVDKFPETFIIGKNGKVVEHVIGAIDWSSFDVLKYFSSLVGG